MSSFTRLQTVHLLISLLLSAHFSAAQDSLKKGDLPTVEYRNYGTYFERITYAGKHHDYFIIDTYLKDSTLYRVDNFRYVNQGNLFGFLAVRHGPTKILYADGRPYLTCDYNMNELNGAFIVYYPDGGIKRRELYKNGNVKKSECYDTDGGVQPCEPFFRQIQFMGNRKELTDYLAKGLGPLLDGVMNRNVSIKLLINEIGQVYDVVVIAGTDRPRLKSVIKQLILEMPRWRENESNWRPAIMDGMPVSETWVINAYQDRGFLKVSFP